MRGRRSDTVSRPLALRLWRAWARALVVLAAVCAAVAWGAPYVAFLAVVTALVVTGIALLFDPPDLRRSARLGVAGAALVLACVGVIAALGWTGVVLLAPLGVIGWVLHAPPPTEGRDSTVVPDTEAEPTPFWVLEMGRVRPDRLRQLTDLELCTEWRRSFNALAVTAHAGLHLEVVQLRQLYLDEIERRHPDGLRRWLASGARAASNPMPFLIDERTWPS